MHASKSSGRKSEYIFASSLTGSILTNHQVSVEDRLTFFHAVVTPVACFAAGHRKIFKQELAALDVAHRKLLRRVVGPPRISMDCTHLDREITMNTISHEAFHVGWPTTCINKDLGWLSSRDVLVCCLINVSLNPHSKWLRTHRN